MVGRLILEPSYSVNQYCVELKEHISLGSIVFYGLKTTSLDIKHTLSSY